MSKSLRRIKVKGTVTTAAARIGEDYRIALAGPILHLVEEALAIGAFRTTMNIQDGWILASLHIVGRRQHISTKFLTGLVLNIHHLITKLLLFRKMVAI